MSLRQTWTIFTSGSANSLAGVWAAKFWIVLPALLALPMVMLFGEGDYLAPILGALWFCAFLYGRRVRQGAEKGSVRAAQGLQIVIWSLPLSAMLLLYSISLALEGGWRWSPPSDGWFLTP